MKLDNRPEDFDGVIVKHRRLATLCMLMGPCGGSANEAVIADMLDMAGFRSTREDVRTCLSDLEKLGAVKTDWFEKLLVVRLTIRGEEIARDLVSDDGIAKPRIECAYRTLT